MNSFMIKNCALEILRSSQKDQEIIEEMSSNMTNIMTSFGLNKYHFKFREWVTIVSEVLYYGFTSIFRLQTLGEEHTAIIRTNCMKNDLPNHLIHIIWLLLHSTGGLCTSKMLNMFTKSVKSNSELLPEAKEQLLHFTGFLQLMLPCLSQLNKALFYFTGEYYDITKRMMGINYVPVRSWLNNNQPNHIFKMLGIITLLYTLITMYDKICKIKHDDLSSYLKQNEYNLGSKCSLCLEKRLNHCITSCGHIFCWNCIFEWTSIKAECPICRDKILPNSNVFLQNYNK